MVVKAVVLTDGDGRVLDAAVMDKKAFNKSTEHGALWTLHADTGRVLPFRNNLPFEKLVDDGAIYRAVVDESTWESSAAFPPDDRGTPTAPPAADGRSGGFAAEGLRWGEVLGGLAEVIRTRKKTLPEGSYTSYLFKAGESKIRKKIGEEAVELILAEGRQETVSEAADLIYHLMVLLSALDIPFNDVIQELESRE